MEDKKTTLYTVYNLRLAGYLMQRGFVLIDLVDGESRKKNFLFVDSPALHDAIDKWMLDRAYDRYRGSKKHMNDNGEKFDDKKRNTM